MTDHLDPRQGPAEPPVTEASLTPLHRIIPGTRRYWLGTSRLVVTAADGAQVWRLRARLADGDNSLRAHEWLVAHQLAGKQFPSRIAAVRAAHAAHALRPLTFAIPDHRAPRRAPDGSYRYRDVIIVRDLQQQPPLWVATVDNFNISARTIPRMRTRVDMALNPPVD